MAQFGSTTRISSDIRLLLLDCFETMVELNGHVYQARHGMVDFLTHYGARIGLPIAVISDASQELVSQALAQELRSAGVSVTALCPGPVHTGFGARAGTSRDMAGGMLLVDAAEVARHGYRAMMAGRRLAIPGRLNQAIAALLPFVPRALTLPALARIQMRRRAR